MTKNYLSAAVNKKTTPQNEPIPGKAMAQNSAGGYVFEIDDWARMRRFLILGAQGGTYYTTERKLTRENADAVIRCIKANGARAVSEIMEISVGGLAAKNDPAIFALALCCAEGDDNTKQLAYAALPNVCRIGTHLFHFCEFVDGLRGWGRGLRTAVANWYTRKTPRGLTLQVCKYPSRDGWSHRDTLRLAHPKGGDSPLDPIFRYVTKGWEGVGPYPTFEESGDYGLIWATERAKVCEGKELLELIAKFNMPMECIPTEKRSPAVYEAILSLPSTGLTWVIRNLGNLSKHGVLTAGSFDNIERVVNRLTTDELRSARVHPINILTAVKTYDSGHGLRGAGTWKAVPKVVDALDEAFYKSFQFVEPTGKRYLLGLDVSGSMGMGTIAGVQGITPREATAAMAMVTNAVEDKVVSMAFAHEFQEFPLSRREKLPTLVARMFHMDFGGTNCALPMVYALKAKIPVDTFIVYTDNETWAGGSHPVQALREYREKMEINARLVVVGMTATNFSIADPSDKGMLDVVGFDSSAPAIISEFSKGAI